MAERVDWTNTRLGADRKLHRLQKSALFRSSNVLTREDGNHDIIEIEMLPRLVKDDKPISMAVAILQHSKLLLLRFVYEVSHVYFIPGSYKLNYCDTDSLCLCKSNIKYLN